MEWIWIVTGVILAIIAIAGSILPLLPGPPVAYIGLLVQQLRTEKPFSTNFLIFWGAIVVLSLLLDYLIPIWGTKKFGGTKYGVWGCTLGFIAAFWRYFAVQGLWPCRRWGQPSLVRHTALLPRAQGPLPKR